MAPLPIYGLALPDQATDGLAFRNNDVVDPAESYVMLRGGVTAASECGHPDVLEMRVLRGRDNN
jgi:hypothetical protein